MAKAVDGWPTSALNGQQAVLGVGGERKMLVAPVLEVLRRLQSRLNPPLNAVVRVLRRRILVERDDTGNASNSVYPATRVEA